MNKNSLITVDLTAIANNVSILKSYLEPKVKFMAVVKADAYGHGACKVATKIANDVYGFAVNTLDEGIELRKCGISNPILVFEPPMEETAGCYKEYDLFATVSDWQHFKLLPAGAGYHLNFNTGMGRIGFRPERAVHVAESVKKYPALHCVGIYSHFSSADDPGSSRGDEQIRIFKEIRAHFEQNLMAHICNTAGIVQYADGHFDLVRSGIGFYGYAPGGVIIPGLVPALTWRTHLVQVNEIKRGETVSYGETWQAPEDGFCGVIPVGYSDGIPRRLSGNFRVSITGKIFPVAGSVTMNYCIIYLGKNELEAGVEVSLLGSHFTAQDWARAVDSISYEILTGFSPHIPRKYIDV